MRTCIPILVASFYVQWGPRMPEQVLTWLANNRLRKRFWWSRCAEGDIAIAEMAPSSSTSESVTSSGVVTGDNPIHHSLLLLIVQIAVIISLSRLVAFLLRPLRQPRVVAGNLTWPNSCWGHVHMSKWKFELSPTQFTGPIINLTWPWGFLIYMYSCPVVDTMIHHSRNYQLR